MKSFGVAHGAQMELSLPEPEEIAVGEDHMYLTHEFPDQIPYMICLTKQDAQNLHHELGRYLRSLR